MNGFRSMLYLDWRMTRWLILALTPLAFGLPLLALRTASLSAASAPRQGALSMLMVLDVWAPFFPLLASLTGAAIALGVWSWDHQQGHVWALSLPVSRSRYVLDKLAAGALLLLIPVVALWLGTLLGTAWATIPDGLRGYPHALAFRFLLAVLLIYALMFALAAGTKKTAGWVIGSFLTIMIGGTILVDALAAGFGVDDPWTPLEFFIELIATWPGPLHVFGANWLPVDV